MAYNAAVPTYCLPMPAMLVAPSRPVAGNDAGQHIMQVLNEELAREASMCEELLAVEPDRSLCKWPLLTLARLRAAQAMLHGSATGEVGNAATSNAHGSAHIYRELLEVDPVRRGYYLDELEGRAQVVTRPLLVPVRQTSLA